MIKILPNKLFDYCRGIVQPLLETDSKFTVLTNTNEANDQVKQRRSNALIYILLAALNVVTVSGSVVLSHSLIKLISDSVTVNQKWAEYLTEVAKLRSLAGALNAPGNDVFDSRDVTVESARLALAQQQFEAQALHVENELQQLDPELRVRLLQHVKSIRQDIQQVVHEAKKIFGYFNQGEPAKAGERMATMDRKSAGVSNAITLLEEYIRVLQRKHLSEQENNAHSHVWFEYTLAFFIVAVALSASLTGYRVHRQMLESAQVRQFLIESLEESEAQIQLILDSTLETALDGIIRMDSTGKVLSWNTHAERMFGWPAREALGQPVADLIIPVEYREAHRRGMEHFLATGVGPVLDKRTELVALRRDGSVFPIEIAITAVCAGTSYTFTAYIRDITEREENETRLREAKDLAESANHAKSEFLANMSHEIRTPMNGIIGMLELALRTELSSRQREFLSMASSSADTLLRLLNDILDFSKIEAGKLVLETTLFSLRDTIGNTLKSLSMLAHNKGIELTYRVAPEVPDAVLGDPIRVSQMIVNLTGNAIKFTSVGEVVIDVDTVMVQDKTIELQVAVRDTGIGIPSEKQQLIFDSFSQVDSSTTRQYGGTGLGLAICKHLCQLMGGRIWVESEVGKGSIFYFTVRLSVSAVPPPQSLAVPKDLPGLPVLVVDDNDTNRLILSEMLMHWGMRPTLVADGPSALRELRRAVATQTPYTMMLLDGMMPAMDGYEVARHVGSDPALKDVTVIMLSSVEPSKTLEQSQVLGIAKYLRKPIKQSELLDAILMLVDPTVSRAPGSLATAAQVPAVAPRQLKVLLAEDTLVNQRLAVNLLEERGHVVTVANNGQEALDCLEREDFDVVLMDIQMPIMDGFQATSMIRKRDKERQRHTPIIAMTAHALKGDRERCLAGGMDKYITKPIRVDEFITTVEEVLLPQAPQDLSLSIETECVDAVFDYPEALTRSRGKLTLLKEMITLFLEDCAEQRSDLRRCLAANDSEALQRIAHKIKGAAGNLSANKVSTTAARLDACCRAKSNDEMKVIAQQLEQELDELGVVLNRFLRDEA